MKNDLLNFIFSLTLVLFSNFFYGQEQEVEELKALINDEKFDEAYEKAVTFIDKFEDDSEFLYYASISSSLKEDYHKSLEYIEIYDKKNPNNLNTIILRTIAYSYLKEDTKVIDNASKVIQSKFEDAEIYYLRGLSYLNTDNYELATNDFKKSIELETNRLEPYYYLGITLFLKEKYNQSLEYLEIIQQYDETNLESYFYTGNIKYSKGLPDAALEDFLTYIQPLEENSLYIRPEDTFIKNMAVSYRSIGNCYFELQEFDKAKEYLEKSLLIEKHALPHYYLALIHRENKNHEESLTHFEELSNYPVEGIFFLEYAKLLLKIENKEKALEQLAIMDKLPNRIVNPSYYYKEAGSVYFLVDDTTSAVYYFLRYLNHNPEDSEIATILEEIFHLNPKKYLNQWLDYTDLLKSQTKNIHQKAYFTAFKSVIYFQNGRLDEALGEIEKAIRIHYYGEYFTFRAFLQFVSTVSNKGELSLTIKQKINNDLNKAIDLGLRPLETYKLKAVIEFYSDEKKEACKAVKQYKKLGGEMQECQYDFFCKDKEDANCDEFDLFFELSSFKERW